MISFEVIDSDFVLKERNKIRAWLRSLATEEGKLLGDLAFVFCTDSYLLELNQKYLQHDTLTDVITFDYTENAKISGDIFISIERVAENAEKFEVLFADEVLRVLAHGILHLCGYEDKNTTAKQQMTAKEDYYMTKFYEFVPRGT